MRALVVVKGFIHPAVPDTLIVGTIECTGYINERVATEAMKMIQGIPGREAYIMGEGISKHQLYSVDGPKIPGPRPERPPLTAVVVGNNVVTLD